MKIKEVQIKNFRSIENISINFKENPRVLVGINESGKTNILEALRLIGPEFQIQDTDIRMTEKGPTEESEILFIFELEKNELEEVYEKVYKEILLDDPNIHVVKVNKKLLNLKEFLSIHYNEGLYEIDIGNNKSRQANFRDFDKKIEYARDFKKPISGANFNFQNRKGETLNILNFRLIDKDSYPKIPNEQLEEANVKILNNLIGNAITGIVNENLPKVVYWKYDDKYLLPPSISINSFTTNPESCLPLMYMFILAGIPKDKIAEKINETRRRSPNYFRTLLYEIAKETTSYFKKAWPEYKNIKISLEPNGENIDCGIKGEKTIQDFKLRSDGFRRFVSILLFLSIPSEKRLLTNALILIDEADQSLHPSGCRYLMEQLIKIAKNNYVIYSTHSIFMIDRENIERHYMLEKKNEITIIKEANEENYRDEEVLYKALGASVYEILEEKNILFEGWRDKRLFEIAIKKDKGIQNFFKKIGISHAQGVKDVELNAFTSILELARRKLLIISDADNVAKERQKQFIQNKRWGKWTRYDKLFKFNQEKIITAEDFIKKETLIKVLKEILKKFKINIELDFNIPLSDRLAYIKNELSNKNIKNELLKEIIKSFKDKLFINLEIEDIEENYFKFLKAFKEEIKNL